MINEVNQFEGIERSSRRNRASEGERRGADVGRPEKGRNLAVHIVWVTTIIGGGVYGIMQFILTLAQAMVEVFYSLPADESGVVDCTEWPVTSWCLAGMVINGVACMAVSYSSHGGALSS